MARFGAALLLVAFSAVGCSADEIFPQGRFDDPTSIEGWNLNYGPGSLEFVPDLDHDFCPNSGGMLLRNTSSAMHGVYSVWQCLPPPAPGQQLEAGFSVLFPADQVGTEIHLVIAYLSGADCTGNILANPNGGFNNYLPPGWRSLSFAANPLAGARSIEVDLFFINANLPGTAEVLVDDIYLRSSSDIFSGNFEQGSRCRWSASTGSSDN